MLCSGEACDRAVRKNFHDGNMFNILRTSLLEASLAHDVCAAQSRALRASNETCTEAFFKPDTDDGML